MQQHITNLILEMIGEDEDRCPPAYRDVMDACNYERQYLRQQVPDLVTKIMNLMEYGKK